MPIHPSEARLFAMFVGVSFAQDTGKLVKSAHEESQQRLAKLANTVKASGVRGRNP